MLLIINARRWFGERFEDRTRSGLPDCFLAAGKHRVWIELKVEKGPYRPGQQAWAIRADGLGEKARTLRCMWDQRFILTDTAATARADLFSLRQPDFITETTSLTSAMIAALEGYSPTMDPTKGIGASPPTPWPQNAVWPGNWPGPRAQERMEPYDPAS